MSSVSAEKTVNKKNQLSMSKKLKLFLYNQHQKTIVKICEPHYDENY